MDYSIKRRRSLPRCLECGGSIGYGRKDKKFCCDDCKNRHHNSLAKTTRSAKRKIISALERNYGVLDKLLMDGVDAIWISDAVALGFNPGYSTSFRKTGRKEHYNCFDISYVMTANRLSSISKIQNLSLTLPAVHDSGTDED